MRFFHRLSDLVTANAHALLDYAEDPQVMLAQTLRDMEEDLARARLYAATAVAAERRLFRELEHHRSRAAAWLERAQAALAAGREPLARQALFQQHDHDAMARSLAAQHAAAAQTADAARAALRTLQARLAEARRTRQLLVARHRAAEVRVAVNRYFGGGDFASAQAQFEQLAARLADEAEELDAQADLDHIDDALDAAFRDVERAAAVERQLQGLRQPPEQPG